MKITEAKMKCPACGWKGTINDCEPDVDGEGSPGCPVCLCNVVMVKAKASSQPITQPDRATRPQVI